VGAAPASAVHAGPKVRRQWGAVCRGRECVLVCVPRRERVCACGCVCAPVGCLGGGRPCGNVPGKVSLGELGEAAGLAEVQAVQGDGYHRA